jgi:hypothetical protein
VYEQQLRDFFKPKPEAKSDPLFQILSIVFQSSPNIGDVGDVYRLLGLENFTRLIHLMDGRTVQFPNSLDLKEAIILTLCYYYKKFENKEWSEIHELLPFEFNSIAISRRMKNLDEGFREKLQSAMREEIMSDVQEEAKGLAGAMESRGLRNDAERIANIEPLDDMKQNLVQFFKDRVSTIKKADQLRESLYQKFQEQLEHDELNPEQILSMYRAVVNESNTAAGDILSIFKPVPNSTSLLLEVSRPPDKDEEIKKAYKTYSAEELQAIERARADRDIGKGRDNAVEAEAVVVS